MAGLNRMGPMNLGSQTGRGMGYCNPNYQGGGFQPGFGMGRGRGMRKGFIPMVSQDDNLAYLKKEKDYLDQMIQNIEKSNSAHS